MYLNMGENMVANGEHEKISIGRVLVSVSTPHSLHGSKPVSDQVPAVQFTAVMLLKVGAVVGAGVGASVKHFWPMAACLR